MTEGLKKWFIRSGPTSAKFSLQSMPRRMASVIEAQKGHTIYRTIYMQEFAYFLSINVVFAYILTAKIVDCPCCLGYEALSSFFQNLTNRDVLAQFV